MNLRVPHSQCIVKTIEKGIYKLKPFVNIFQNFYTFKKKKEMNKNIKEMTESIVPV